MPEGTRGQRMPSVSWTWRLAGSKAWRCRNSQIGQQSTMSKTNFALSLLGVFERIWLQISTTQYWRTPNSSPLKKKKTAQRDVILLGCRHLTSVICCPAVHRVPATCLDCCTVFTICGKPVVLKVESLQLMQIGNVLHCYLLDFVVLEPGDTTQTVNPTADERPAPATP